MERPGPQLIPLNEHVDDLDARIKQVVIGD